MKPRHFPAIFHPVLSRRSAQTVILDTFGDSNGVGITSHAADVCPPGSAWMGNYYTIQANKAQSNNATEPSLIDSLVADCTLSVEITLSDRLSNAAGAEYLLFRATDNLNRWGFGYGYNSGVIQICIYERTSGVSTVRAAASISYSPGTSHTLKAVLLGSQMSCTLDNITTLEYSSSVRQAVTTHGLRSYWTPTPTTTTIFDNFKVTTT